MLDFSEFKQNMQKGVNRLEEDLKTIRSNRANASILDSVLIEVYGQKMRVVELGTINVPEPRLITISPWDKSQVQAISKAILETLEINPTDDGNTIRIALPALTEETRNSLIKKVKELAEGCKVSLRNHRREALEEIEGMKKTGQASEDDFFRGKENLNKLIEEEEKKVDEIIKRKEEELREI